MPASRLLPLFHPCAYQFPVCPCHGQSPSTHLYEVADSIARSMAAPDPPPRQPAGLDTCAPFSRLLNDFCMLVEHASRSLLHEVANAGLGLVHLIGGFLVLTCLGRASRQQQTSGTSPSTVRWRTHLGTGTSAKSSTLQQAKKRQLWILWEMVEIFRAPLGFRNVRLLCIFAVNNRTRRHFHPSAAVWPSVHRPWRTGCRLLREAR